MSDTPASSPGAVRCPDCSTPATRVGQSFCDACGAFLRWDAQGAAAPAAPEAESPQHTVTLKRPSRSDLAPPPPDDPRASAPTPPAGVPTPPSVAQHGPAHGTFGPATSSFDVAGAPGPADPEATVPRPPVVEPPRPQSTAHALLVPVPESSPYAATPPGGVLPGRPDAARPQVRTGQTAPQPVNGAPCPACATPNPPHRHFCRSCATPLAPQDASTAEGPYAGQRPRLHRDRRRWIARALVAVAVVAVAVGGIVGGPPAARAVQDHFAKRVAVHPTAWKASHAAKGHDAKQAFDSYSNTWWGTGYANDSAGQYVEATFGQPTDLLNMVITPGTSAVSGQAVSQARPQEFDLVVTDSSGKIHTSRKRIDDGGAQRVDLRVKGAVTVRLVLRSAYGAGADKQVAIAELEFFGGSKA
ncbi:zinc ribbon domain-containing protein [Streptomyces sp. NPDC050738]|uniref:NADase-type glycan-binding domain-containing protein n=1 Tax=Streptomyces sp. NPDC050738 TaxID=3154744 RepID=UPI0034146CE9